MVSTSAKTPPTTPAPTPTPPTAPAPTPIIAGDIPLTVEQHHYLATEGPVMPEEIKILLKETVTPDEAKFLNKKMSIEKKLMSGAYDSLTEPPVKKLKTLYIGT